MTTSDVSTRQVILTSDTSTSGLRMMDCYFFHYCRLLRTFYSFQTHTRQWNTVTTGARSVRLVVLHIMLPFSSEILTCDNKAF
jgi:hypothetical protein